MMSQLKYPLSYMCLANAVVASGSLTLETTGSNPFDDIFGSFNSANLVKTFRENSNVLAHLLCHPAGTSINFAFCEEIRNFCHTFYNGGL